MLTFPIGLYSRLILLSGAVIAIIYFSTLIFAPISKSDFFVSRSQSSGMGCADFVIFYGAGVISASPDRFKIYDPNIQLKIENQLIAPEQMGKPFYIPYPPWFFTLMAPWSALSLRSAFVVWSIVWTLLAALSTYFLLRTTIIRSLLDRALFIAFMLGSAPAMLNAKLGQTSLWFFTCACLMFYFWRRKAFRTAAIFLALSSFKLQFSVFLIIPFLALRKWRALLVFALLQSLLMVAACLNVGIKSFLDYPTFVLAVEGSGEGGVAPESMVNLGAILLRYLPSGTARVGAALVLLLSLLYLFAVWWRAKRLPVAAHSWPIAATCVIALVASPHTHFHMCILLSVAAAVTLKSIDLLVAARDSSAAYRFWAMSLIYAAPVSWLVFISSSEIPLLMPLCNLFLMVLAIINTEMFLMRMRR
jgi:hypothetical protein